MLMEALLGYEEVTDFWGRDRVGDRGHGGEIGAFGYLGALWTLQWQRRYVIRVTGTNHGARWVQKVRVVDGRLTPLGRS